MNKITKNMHKRNDISEGPIKEQMYGWEAIIGGMKG